MIGAGWAGLACAVEATRAGHHVTLFEAARTAGGRARVLSASAALTYWLSVPHAAANRLVVVVAAVLFPVPPDEGAAAAAIAGDDLLSRMEEEKED